MEGIRNYLVSVIAASILCACIRVFFDEKSSSGKVSRLICGLFLAFTVIAPVADIKITDFALFAVDLEAEARAVSAAGEEFSQNAMAQIIISKTEAYILDKAQAMGAELTVLVEIGDPAQPVPTRVQIRGNVSPYARSELQRIIAEDLGIPKEDQLWME